MSCTHLPRRPRPPRSLPSDGGQALPFVGLLLALAVALVIGVGHVGRLLVDAAAARTAADAAALAGAAGDAEDARALAARNGATLVSFERHGAVVEVTVRVGRAQATARARRSVHVASAPRRSAPAGFS